MSITLRGNVTASISAQQINTLSSLSAVYQGTPAATFQQAFDTTDITQIYFATRTVAGAADSLDLLSGLTDNFNQSIVFATLKACYVYNKDSTNSLTVFGGTHGTIANTLVLSAGGNVLLTSAFTVDATHNIIKIDPGANTIIYDIFLLGN